jgi:hypothetical protein
VAASHSAVSVALI